MVRQGGPVGATAAGAALAAGADLGQAAKQETNWTAIGMFAAFVAGTFNSHPLSMAAAAAVHGHFVDIRQFA